LRVRRGSSWPSLVSVLGSCPGLVADVGAGARSGRRLAAHGGRLPENEGGRVMVKSKKAKPENYTL
jgi:hypothetical protein